jgi:hypothetical protein
MLGIEFVPAFLFTSEDGANGGFVGGLLRGCGLGGESEDGDGECDGETGHFGFLRREVAHVSEAGLRRKCNKETLGGPS